MSKRRLRLAPVAALLALALSPGIGAQGQSVDDVLKLTAVYVSEFRKQLSGIVAEETYVQQIANTGRFVNTTELQRERSLKSDLFLVKPGDSDQYVELRDTFDVDGTPVREGEARVEDLLGARTAGADASIAEIINQSARYNIGSVTRNINTPLMALMFLDTTHQPRFRFKHVEKPKPVFTDAKDKAINEAPVFRVSTEMWTVEYEERQKPTIVRSPTGDNRPAHGRFWINPQNGSVLISEMIVDTGGVIATVTVSYQSEPLMGFMVPTEMRESYIRYGERISGRAEYGKFRPIKP